MDFDIKFEPRELYFVLSLGLDLMKEKLTDMHDENNCGPIYEPEDFESMQGAISRTEALLKELTPKTLPEGAIGNA